MEYKAPIRFDEEIKVGFRVPRTGRSSLIFALGVAGKGETGMRAGYSSGISRESGPDPNSVRG